MCNLPEKKYFNHKITAYSIFVSKYSESESGQVCAYKECDFIFFQWEFYLLNEKEFSMKVVLPAYGLSRVHANLPIRLSNFLLS